MIAAIAIANDLPLYTCHPDDFSGIDRLVIVPVALQHWPNFVHATIGVIYGNLTLPVARSGSAGAIQ